MKLFGVPEPAILGLMERTHRMERVNDVLLNLLSPLILELYPTNDLVTVIAVETAGDLRSATVTITAAENVPQHVKALNKLAWELQKIIKPKLDFRAIPKLTFVADTRGAEVGRLESILDQL